MKRPPVPKADQRDSRELEERIAELERRVAELEPSETRFRRLIERNADGIVIVDDLGIIRFVNPAAESLFGRSAHELLGQPFGFPVVTSETIEIDLLRRDADPITAELRAVTTVWEGEKACLVSLRDVTDRKRVEQQERELIREQTARAAAEQAERRHRELARESADLAEENARLYQESQEANRAKSDFLAVMSHELRTPLNAIISYADLLAAGIAGPLNDEQDGQLERIASNARHLEHIVNEILSFTEMESGREAVNVSDVDVKALVEEVSQQIAPTGRTTRVTFHNRLPAAPVTLKTDAGKVRQILFNLLSNAFNFTPGGEVCLELVPEADAVVIRVVDNGIGIAPEHLERIWQPFWQVDQAQTRTVGGTGLGLSVTKRLVDLLGGEIHVESSPGSGSTFTLHLRRAPPPSSSQGT